MCVRVCVCARASSEVLQVRQNLKCLCVHVCVRVGVCASVAKTEYEKFLSDHRKLSQDEMSWPNGCLVCGQVKQPQHKQRIHTDPTELPNQHHSEL